MRVNRSDLVCGGLFLAIGLFFALQAWLNLPIGRAFQMGPGYFPIVLGGLLMALGAGIALGAVGKPTQSLGVFSLRGTGLVVAAVLFFAVTVRPLGMLPALLVSTMLAAYSTKQATFRSAMVLSILLTIFNIGLFIYALRLPYPVFGYLFTGRGV